MKKVMHVSISILIGVFIVASAFGCAWSVTHMSRPYNDLIVGGGLVSLSVAGFARVAYMVLYE